MPPVTIRPLDRPGDLGWVVLAHGEVYAREFGWDASFEAAVAQYVGDYATRPDQSRQAGWIVEIAGERMGCVFCESAEDPDLAKLRMLVVRPEARGHGLGRRLVDCCLDFARAQRYERMQLWTVSILAAARRIYTEAGFELVQEDPVRRRFGTELVGLTYETDLTRTASESRRGEGLRQPGRSHSEATTGPVEHGVVAAHSSLQ